MPKPYCQTLPEFGDFKRVWRFAKGSETLIVNIRAARDEKVEVWLFRDQSGPPAEVHVVDGENCEGWLLEKRAELMAEGWGD